MSREVIIRIKDDFDEGLADETLEFSVRGVAYEIDLNNANVEKFDKALAEFIEVARKVVMPKVPKQKQPHYVSPADRPRIEQGRRIREWANGIGMNVRPDRGIISNIVLQAYKVAHPDEEMLVKPSRMKHAKKKTPPKSVTAQELKNPSDVERRRKYKDTQGVRDEIRNWANENGYEQAPVGMIKREVYDAYYAEFPKKERIDGR